MTPENNLLGLKDKTYTEKEFALGITLNLKQIIFYQMKLCKYFP